MYVLYVDDMLRVPWSFIFYFLYSISASAMIMQQSRVALAYTGMVCRPLRYGVQAIAIRWCGEFPELSSRIHMGEPSGAVSYQQIHMWVTYLVRLGPKSPLQFGDTSCGLLKR